jgi:pimeloyl-ACP methyl ester carboxylesterase
MPVTVYPPGLVLTEREFDVPLRYLDPEGERITVFAREVAAPGRRDRPFLVFLQGGPGMEAPRPTAHPSAPGWLERALKDFRVLMLDQRGTGRSTPVASLEGMSPEEQAGYLACFRADSIVQDAEFIPMSWVWSVGACLVSPSVVSVCCTTCRRRPVGWRRPS